VRFSRPSLQTIRAEQGADFRILSTISTAVRTPVTIKRNATDFDTLFATAVMRYELRQSSSDLFHQPGPSRPLGPVACGMFAGGRSTGRGAPPRRGAVLPPPPSAFVPSRKLAAVEKRRGFSSHDQRSRVVENCCTRPSGTVPVWWLTVDLPTPGARYQSHRSANDGGHDALGRMNRVDGLSIRVAL